MLTENRTLNKVQWSTPELQALFATDNNNDTSKIPHLNTNESRKTDTDAVDTGDPLGAQNSNGTPIGAIVGGVVGGVGALVIAGLITWVLLRRRKRRQQAEVLEETAVNSYDKPQDFPQFVADTSSPPQELYQHNPQAYFSDRAHNELSDSHGVAEMLAPNQPQHLQKPQQHAFELEGGGLR